MSHKNEYAISGSVQHWPIKHIESKAGFPHPLVLLGAPPRSQAEIDVINSYLDSGHSLIGLCIFQNFPGKIVFSGASKIEKNFDVWKSYGSNIEGWLYNMRNPEAYFDKSLPTMRLNHSDFTSYDRITPKSIDSTSFKQGKRYDFTYICLPGSWNKFIRNWSLATQCIKIFINAGYRVAVIGPEDNRDLPHSGRLTLLPRLPWAELLQQMAFSRCLFVPNVYDASPRIMAEALCLDVPLLVNQEIFGGWHYVNHSSGQFFVDESNVLEAGCSILESDSLEPRAFFISNFGQQKSGQRLYEFIEDIVEQRPTMQSPGKIFLLKSAIKNQFYRYTKTLRRISNHPINDPVKLARNTTIIESKNGSSYIQTNDNKYLINDGSRVVLMLCDGSRTPQEIVQLCRELFPDQDGHDIEQSTIKCIEESFASGILEFA